MSRARDTTFDHHDPDIETLMQSRAEVQARGDRARHPRRVVNRSGMVLVDGQWTEFTERMSQVVQYTRDMVVSINTMWATINSPALTELFRMLDDDPDTIIVEALARVLTVEFDPAPRPVGNGSGLERARHGSSAVCPKHGPTKAGLCRSCARNGDRRQW